MSDNPENVSKSKGGRPKKDPAKGRRGSYSFRMSEFTRAQLEGKTKVSGRSLSEEVEYRVEQSLQRDNRLHAHLAMLGGADMLMFAVLMTGDLRIGIQEADRTIGGQLAWFENPEKLAIVQARMRDVTDRTVATFARMAETGVAKRTGEHAFQLGVND